MTTSLAAQLEKLAVPQTSLLERDKKRPSLLFDPKEAATIDRDTFYDIGIGGLRNLINLDKDFGYFENNLFSSTSKTVERAVQDKKTNQNLNKTIRKFFISLSPYLLLKPAHQALEWLIQRFSIHEYNTDDFLKLIFPYHETNIFVRCLRLFNFRKDNNKWNWLSKLQKAGVHLPKITLYNHCTSDVGFLKIIGRMVAEAVSENGSKASSMTTLFTFYCTTTIGMLENVQEVTEPQLTAILPPLLKGLLSSISDYTASSYMILAQLVKKTKLSQKILNALVQRISNNEQNDLREEATLLILLIYQSQREHFNTVSREVLDNLATSEWFPINLGKLAAGGSYVLPLFIAVLRSSLKAITKDRYKYLVLRMFSEVQVDDISASSLISIVLECYPTATEEDDNNSAEEEDSSDSEEESEKTRATTEWYSKFITKLEHRYPTPFDQIVRQVLSSQTSASQKQADALKHILTCAMSTDNNNSYTIFEKLYHPNENFRLAAIEFLVTNFDKLSRKDKELLQGAVNECMLDKDSRVINAILKLKPSDLMYLLGINNFVEVVIKLLTKCIQDEKYYQIMPSLIRHICYGDISREPNLILFILPFLFPVDNSELELSKSILLSDFGKNFNFIKKKQLKTVDLAEQFCKIIYHNLLKNNIIINVLKMVKFPERMLNIHKYLKCILIASSLPENSSAELGVKALLNIRSYLEHCQAIEQKVNFDIVNCVFYARKNILPLQGIIECVKIVINKTECADILECNNWIPLFSSSPSVSFLIHMVTLLVKGCHMPDKESVKSYSALFKIFLNKYFLNFKQNINFFANIILCDNDKLIDSKTQLQIIKILISLISQSKESIVWTVQSDSNIVPAILSGLIHSLQEIRIMTFEIIDHLANLNVRSNNVSYIPLLKELLKHKQEILMDCEQFPLILYAISENKSFKQILNVLYNTINKDHVPMHVNSKLLKILTFVNSDEIFERAALVAIQVLKSAENKNITLDVHNSFIVTNVLLRFNENSANAIKLNSFSWEFITLALKQDVVSLQHQETKYSCPSVLLLTQINKETFCNLHIDIQSALIQELTNIATVSENSEVVSAVHKIVKKIEVDAQLFLSALTAMKDIKAIKPNVHQRKFRRVCDIPSVDVLDMIEWKRGITVLEFIQDKKKLTNAKVLLPVLFEILKKCLKFDDQSSLEYPKQIILSAILHICNKVEVDGVVFNMELVVQCIRASQNPQTHHHALLVLAHVATIVPDQVLHNIMAIFTFMGSSVLRHDDAYSFQIISKIIDTIIPILVKGKSEQTETNIAAVLRVFVDVILDIPEHRRIPLFKKLLITLGVEEYMWLFLVLIFESQVQHGNEKNNADSIPKRLNIATSIALEFTPDIILSTTIKLLEYLKSLPNEADENTMDIELSTFNIKQHTPKQFRHYKYIIVTFLPGLLSSTKLVNMIAVLNNDDLLDLEPFYKNMIINILTYIQSVSKIVDRVSNTPQAQYWKVMLHHSFDVMDCINALLTTEMFLLVIRGLIVHNIPTVRRKALEIFNSKLQYQPSFFYSSTNDDQITDAKDLFAIMPSLLNIIKSVEQKDIESDQELTQQTALLSLKLLIKLLATNNPDQFIPILNYITDLLKSKKISSNILSSVVLCLAELCSKLRARAIPGLAKYMPALIKVLKSQKYQEAPGLLLMCTITAIQKIVESLSLFLSPYLEELLCELSILSSKWANNEENPKLTPLIKKLDSIRNNIGKMIPARILIPIISQSYNTLLKKNEFYAVGPLMSVLAENLSQLRGADLNNHMSELTTFFLSALQFRTDYNTDVNFEIINSVEDHLIKSLTVLVLKLSETTFRPFYYRLFDWAVHNEIKTERVITFYRISCGFAESLKSLFVLFAGHFIKNASSLLDSCNNVKSDTLYFSNETKNTLLIGNILATLKAVFSYDNQNFVDKDKFEALMQPIVDQLENTVGGIDSLSERARNILVPCVAQFAVAIADDALWKQLNYQILLKARHNLPTVRLVALSCLCEIARNLGEDFLPLLPETIPFLAELLEDEDEQVEAQCQKVIQDLEKSLGEPLQKYF